MFTISFRLSVKAAFLIISNPKPYLERSWIFYIFATRRSNFWKFKIPADKKFLSFIENLLPKHEVSSSNILGVEKWVKMGVDVDKGLFPSETPKSALARQPSYLWHSIWQESRRSSRSWIDFRNYFIVSPHLLMAEREIPMYYLA